jgi:alkanesulfonate monooxygenase SsuD/methylene tetrahydromethanopterin reductase-like flavin-dependent oxidoreductase (luciferase family)
MGFMPYADLPADHHRYPSMWVDYPNRLYDPVKGHALYNRYLSEYVLADQLGYDGLVVNEHHSTAYSMMPACSLIAAALIPQTQRAKICVFGTPVNLEYPNRLAEEYAMLDVMSGGRLELAFPLGTGMEYWANANQLNPATARARLRESMDIVLQAWTQDGPSTFDGEFFNYRYLNVWPKPFQKPHPPIFVVGTGSPSTMAYAAEKGYGYSVVFIPIQGQLAAFAWLREQWRAHGHEPRPDMITFNALVYVGETDEEAEREGKPHILNFFNNFLRTTPRYLAPPGYVSIDEFRRRAMTPALHGEASWGDLTAQNRVIAARPERVAEAIAGWLEDAGSNKLIVNLQLADMPHWKTVKNMTLFAEQVLPVLRKLSPAVHSSANNVVVVNA